MRKRESLFEKTLDFVDVHRHENLEKAIQMPMDKLNELYEYYHGWY